MSQQFERFGKYILLEKIASGGMAEVYLARSSGASGVNKFVAIKRILPQYSDNPDFIDMFKEEAKIAVNLQNSNVVQIFDFGTEKNQFFLVMEYVEGKNLKQIINELKKNGMQLSIDQIVYLVKEVAAGLDHAHRCLDGATGRPLNITHRDMSPQNVMISFDGEVKIIDFGIAKAETQIEITKAGTLKGKFGYMSPEQADGHNIDLRTDIFSLGIVLWELLANDRLFTSSSEAAILRKIRDCQIPNIRKLNPSVPPELEKIVSKSLAKDRSLRYQTAASLHRDLNRFLNVQYPEFSAQDFSIFIKTAFSQQLQELKKRLIDYSKIENQDDDRTTVTDLDKPTEVTENSTGAIPNLTGKTQNFDKLEIDSHKNVPVKLKSMGLGALKKHDSLNYNLNPNPQHRNYQNSKYTLRKQSPAESASVLTTALKLVLWCSVGIGSYVIYKNLPRNIASSIGTKTSLKLKSQNENLSFQNSELLAQQEAITSAKNSEKLSQDSFTVAIESVPSGAHIFIDGIDTERFTPYNVFLDPNKTYQITIRKDSCCLPFETRFRPNANPSRLSATLQPLPKTAYVSISVSNGGTKPIITIDGKNVHEPLPIDSHPIPADVPVKIQVINTFTHVTAEQTVNLRPNTKKFVELILAPPKSQNHPKK